jgi:hypothetical protein
MLGKLRATNRQMLRAVLSTTGGAAGTGCTGHAHGGDLGLCCGRAHSGPRRLFLLLLLLPLAFFSFPLCLRVRVWIYVRVYVCAIHHTHTHTHTHMVYAEHGNEHTRDRKRRAYSWSCKMKQKDTTSPQPLASRRHDVRLTRVAPHFPHASRLGCLSVYAVINSMQACVVRMGCDGRIALARPCSLGRLNVYPHHPHHNC